jgi:hypothetical protein
MAAGLRSLAAPTAHLKLILSFILHHARHAGHSFVRTHLTKARKTREATGSIVDILPGARGLTQDQWHKIKNRRQRLVLCRLMIDLMRGVHTAYAPASEPFGTRLETFFIGLCVALGHMDGKLFSVAKIAAYMRVPRSTVIRRLDRLQRWGLIYRQGRRYYLHDRALNSFIGVRSYQTSRRLLSKATEELTILDTLPD